MEPSNYLVYNSRIFIVAKVGYMDAIDGGRMGSGDFVQLGGSELPVDAVAREYTDTQAALHHFYGAVYGIDVS